MDLNLRVAGEAGQGVQTLGNLLVESLAQMGVHVLASQSYMSRIRGGLNWFDIRIGDHELHGPAERADLLIALTDQAAILLRDEVAPDGLLLQDSDDDGSHDGVRCMPFTRSAKDIAGQALMGNVVAAGAVLTLLGYELTTLEKYVHTHFDKKGPEVVEQNLACARRGTELARPHAGRFRAPPPGQAGEFLIAGAEAIGLGAATAGLKFVSAYPMTPGTATMTYLVAVSERYGIVIEQAEDEIAAMNMIVGAAYAGAPALTTTSGGGFALMVEALSLAAMLELPAVIVLAQRPGPATGQPTRTAQQDLLFALHAGHGEFARAVLAPGDVRQCYDLARHALALAHQAQTPVILLTDQFLQDLQQNIPKPDFTCRPIDRCIVRAEQGYARYALTDSGVSPRAIPGGPAPVVVDSDEHDIHGHISEDLADRLAQNDKRLRKAALLERQAIPPELYGPADARTLLVCWGSTCGPCREAVRRLADAGRSAAMLHFSQVWPLNLQAARQHLRPDRRMVAVEANATGQFAQLLRLAGLPAPHETILRCDGLAFTADYILERLAP